MGIIGSVSAAAFYAVFDIFAARGAFFTVDLLGKSLFTGMSDATALGLPTLLDVTSVAWYSGLHLLISLVIGLIVVRLVLHSEQHPSQAKAVLAVIVLGFVVTVIAIGLLTSPIRLLLPLWTIVAANVLAVLVAGAYLVRKHPDAWGRLLSPQ